MNIASFCVKRPVTTIMFFLGIILLGIISYSFFPQELFPSLTYPQLTVLTEYEGSSPQEIETLITRILEEAVGTVNRVKKVSSISKEGVSIIILEFEWGTNMDFASLEVREKLDLVKEKLPRDAKDPIVMKFNPFEVPMMRINLTGDVSPLKLRRIGKKDFKEEIEKIEGVGAVEVVGGLEREIRVELEETKLRSATLSILDVVKTLKKSNLNYPAGKVEGPFFEYLIRTVGEFHSTKDIENLSVKADFPVPEEKLFYFKKYFKKKEKEEQVLLPSTVRLVFVKDLGKVIDTTKKRESISRFQGKECVTLLVRRQSQANIVQLSKKIKATLEEIMKKKFSSPNTPKITYNIVYDEAEFIKSSLREVKNAAIEGGVLAFLVIFFFLRNLWFSLGIILMTPLCILIVFILMYFTKISLNIISLGGLALGVGMLVDNGIVVLESIFINPSSHPKEKVVRGTGEVIGAITGSTLTSISVFLPMVFIVGLAGQLFKHLSFTVVFSLLASLLTAATILPLWSYGYIKKYSSLNNSFGGVSIPIWGRIFGFFFSFRILVLLFTIILFVISLQHFLHLNKELFPKVDQHQLLIKIDAPPGTTLQETDKISREIEKILFTYPEAKEVTANIGSSEETKEKIIQSQEANQGQIFVKIDKNTPTASTLKKLKEALKPLNFEKKDIKISLLAQESFLKRTFTQQAPIVLEIKGYDLKKLKEIGIELNQKLKKIPFLYNLKLDSPPPRPEIKIDIKKDKALLYNIYPQLIGETIRTSVKGKVETKYKEKGEEYDIRVILKEEDREDIRKLERLIIHGFYQDRVIHAPLFELAKITRGTGPLRIKRVEKQRTLLLSASIFNVPLSKAIKEIKKVIGEVSLPRGYEIKIGGEFEDMQASLKSLRFALLLGLTLVFMVMAGEFESLWHPFLILFTLPFALIGITPALILTHSTLNVITMLGMIVLGGIVVNDGIVLIDYVNFLRRKQKIELKEALRKASQRRIRPILMTSFTTILGVLPLSIGRGGGLMQPLGIVTIGGLLSSTFLTPVVLPLLYYYLEKLLNVFTPSLKEEKEEKETLVQKELFPPKIIKKREEEMAFTSSENQEKKTLTTSTKNKQKTTKSARKEWLLSYLKEKKSITRAEYAKLLNISIPTAARDLKVMTKKGLIEGKGPLGPGRIYVLKNKNSAQEKLQ